MVLLSRKAAEFRQAGSLPVMNALLAPQDDWPQPWPSGVARIEPPPLPSAELPSSTENGRPVRQKTLPPSSHPLTRYFIGPATWKVGLKMKSPLKLWRIS